MRAILFLMTLSTGLAGIATGFAADPATTDRYIVSLEGKGVAAAFGSFPRSENTRRSDNGRVRLDARSPQARAYANEVGARQDRQVAEIESMLGHNLNVLDRYEYVLNGILVEMSEIEAEQVRRLSFVRAVEREVPLTLYTDRVAEFIGAESIYDGSATPSGVGNEGEGMVIGIVDSGMNSGHESYAATGGDGYIHTNPLGGNYLGVCSGGNTDPNFTCNDKLIGSYTLIGGGSNDTGGHGSHVTGTAGGNFISQASFIDVLTGNDYPAGSITGVARHANLINYKNCQDGCTNLAAAFDQAVQDGIVDSMNFSIGPNAGGTVQDPWGTSYLVAMLDAVNAGIFVAAAAGNTSVDVPDPVGNVANHAPWIMTVANSTHDRYQLQEVSITGPGVPPDAVTEMYGLEGTGPAFTGDINAEVIHAGDVGNLEGCNPGFPANSFDGAVALISRGSCTFAEKVNNAEASGAVAVVVHNNAGHVPIGMAGLEATGIPSLMIGFNDGDALVGFIGSNPSPQIFIDDELFYTVGDDYANYLSAGSLTGPNELFDITAPDIAAPGSLILAATATGDDYMVISGTSMASPHITGSAALVMNEHPGWTVQEVKSALMMTADASANNTRGDAVGTPDEVGHGMLDLTQAAMSGLVMHESHANFLAADPDVGGDPATLNIPSMRRNSCGTDCSWERTVRSTLDTNSNWDVVTSGDMDVVVSPTSFELLPGDVLFRGSFETDSEPVSSFQTLEISAENVPAGTDYSFGEVVLSESGGGAPDARLTIAVRQ